MNPIEVRRTSRSRHSDLQRAGKYPRSGIVEWAILVNFEKVDGRTETKKLERVLVRDHHLCGVHLSGCRKPIKPSEGYIDHIVPKAIVREPYDHYMDRKARREWARHTHGMLLPKELNIQSMNIKCNKAMGSEFPPTVIEKHCECCKWIYVLRYKSGGIRPIMIGDDQNFEEGSQIILLRIIQTGGFEIGKVEIRMKFGPWISVE